MSEVKIKDENKNAKNKNKSDIDSDEGKVKLGKRTSRETTSISQTSQEET